MTTASFSPQFSNAAPDHEPPAAVTAPGAAQKLSRPKGDHHMLFVDPAPAGPTAARRVQES